MSSAIDSDTPGSNDDDPFGRAAFAAQLADYLRIAPGAESVVLGLEGEWGSGKTWVIERIKKQLTASSNEADNAALAPPVALISFNPWLIGSETELIAAFMDELAAQILEHAQRWPKMVHQAKTLVGKIAAYGDKLTYLKYLKYVPMAAGVGQLVEDHEKQIKEGAEKLQKALTPGKMSLAASRAAIEKALHDFAVPLVVIIDDLDRLRPQEIQTMIQLVKAVGNFRGVAYLLSYDAKYVAQALSHDGTPGSGYAYLEKIVQLSCHLPPLVPWIYRDWLNARTRHFLRERNKKLMSFEERNFDEAIKLAARLLRHPRDACRWFNRLRWVFGSVAEAIDINDLLVMEALQLVAPSSIQALIKTPQLVFPQHDEHFFVEEKRDNEQDAMLIAWRKQIADHEDMQRAIVWLFPHLYHPKFRTPRDEAALGNRRLQVYKHWRRYLNLTSIPGQQDTVYFMQLLSNSKEFDRLENKFADIEEFGAFCDAIEPYLTSENLPQKSLFLQAFLATTRYHWQYGLLTDEIFFMVLRCLEKILQAFKQSEKDAALDTILDHTPLSLNGNIINNIKDTFVTVTEFDGRRSDQIKTNFTLKEKWLKNITNDEKYHFLVMDDGIRILKLLAEFKNLRSARKLAARIVADKKLDILLRTYEGRTCDNRDATLFFLLPNPVIIQYWLKSYCTGGRQFKELDKFITQEGALIKQSRKDVAEKLLHVRRAQHLERRLARKHRPQT